MAIPEQKLSSWSRLGAQQGSANTYNSIKLALDRHHWPQGMDHHVYLQGSYPSYTNIHGDSDVDVVVESRNVFHHNVPENFRAYYRLTTPAPYTWQQFREEVKRALVNYYGPHGVKDGNKCIKVAGSGNRLNADIVPCTTYRQYDNPGRYVTGITFWSRSGVRIVNFPKSHRDNGAYKNDRCQECYKPNVRVFKNARNYAGNNLPSYFLECMVYNVPDSNFSRSHAVTFFHAMNFLLVAIRNGSIRSFLCQNEHQSIFGTASHQIDVAVRRAVRERHTWPMEQLALKMPFYILSLDGGGSLGIYTLGVLIEIERMLGKRLHEVFDLVYGTSTGSIIGSMIALGEEIDTIRQRYLEIAPDVMGRWFPRRKSVALRRYAEKIFGRKKFDDFLIDIGIVATHLEYNRPMVFKRNVGQAHGSQASFRPGFGCTIADAVTASCAAHPVFRAKSIIMPDHGVRTVVDGGFSANNPALFALADALGPLKIPRSEVRVLSIGTGEFPERRRLLSSMFSAFTPTRNIMTLLGTSSNTVTVLQGLLFRDVHALRINETFSQKTYRTDFIESNVHKLEQFFQLGRRSFGKNETEIGRSFQESSGISREEYMPPPEINPG